MFRFEPTFLAKPVDEWEGDENYKAFKSLVNAFSPLNDAAERAVKFASDFNGSITLDENEHKGMLQGIEAHQHSRPNATHK